MSKRARPETDAASVDESCIEVYKVFFASVSTGESKVDEDRAMAAIVRAARSFREARAAARERADTGTVAQVKFIMVAPVLSPLVAKLKRQAAAEGIAPEDLGAKFGTLAQVQGAFALGVGTGERWRRPGENHENVQMHRAGLGHLVQTQYGDDDGILRIGELRVVDVPASDSLRKKTGAHFVVCVRGPVVNQDKPGFCGADYASNGAEATLEGAYLSMFEAVAVRADDATRARMDAKREITQAKRRKQDTEDLIRIMRAAHSCVDRGLVDRLGLCNVTLAQLEAVLGAGIPVASVQNELSAWDMRSARASGKFGGTLQYCQDHGIAFIAIKTFGGTAFRKDPSGFKGLEQRFPLAAREDMSPFALWLACSAQKWPCLVHVPGATQIAHVLDCQRAAISLVSAVAEDSAFEQVFDSVS
ncbi:Hypothetical Protein FCC1311_056122 [Hondaea fermentalgiana]|uniref:NADP-dependent oxidoreductase domain-containing protein n=1 Tax=Hondaea fermentalgiana TaxID=2315210 RepID=A0A2R5GEM5_9STRA|nr:Hypothetical Protein FCC1311_056122 [Hondaea fermentalgiana]|eukprot:GBG29390.1 Hypothetical Protein FCC1311_056122 [Hondaea fermentalgiana]